MVNASSSMIQPLSYKISLTPDLGSFRFSGYAHIDMALAGTADTVVLNARDLAVWRCTVKADGKDIACPFFVNPKEETLTVSLPKQLAGNISMAVDYEGKIHNDMAGLYRSRYRVDGRIGYMAVTQFQESDARRAFPCFDRPGAKATFEIELIVDQALTAISNAAIAEEVPLDNGTKRVSFAPTPVMSPYLVFMAVGPFEIIEDPADVLVRVAAMPGKIPYASFGLAFGRKALTYCQDYYAIAYPFSKLDLIAVEDFAAGAMENWGAMTFRENLLLHDPKTTSRAGEQRICEVIAHETAHQWFGDLVTPSDWKYLWLNESFATFFGYGVIDHAYPQWDVWPHFLYAETATALQRDGLHNTCAIEIAGGEHVVINTSTAPIIYNKGASVLRQIQGYIGEQSFRNGVRRFLKKHAYACASSRDLWKAFEEVCDVPVSSMMESWVYEQGHPVVSVFQKDSTLHLSQKRFTFLPNHSTQRWVIPVTVDLLYDDGRRETVKTIMDGETTAIECPTAPRWYKVNTRQTGFYRVFYHDDENVKRLGQAVHDQTLPPEDRWGIQNDLYAQVLAAKVPLRNYLAFLPYYEKEDTFLPLVGIAGNLFHTHLVTEGSTRENVVTCARSFVENILSWLPWQPAAQEPQAMALLRDPILWHAALYGSEAVTAWMADRFHRLMDGDPVHPDIARSLMQAGALMGDDTIFAWFCRKLDSSDSEHERINILTAMGCFSKPALLEKIRQYILQEVAARNKYLPLAAMSANPHAMTTMWPWFLENLAALESFPPVHFERVIASIVPICGMSYEKEVRSFFDAYVKKNDKVKDTVSLSVEKLDINLRMRYEGL